MHLEAVDLDECRRRQTVTQTVRGLEARAARQMGLAAISALVGLQYNLNISIYAYRMWPKSHPLIKIFAYR